jgi:ATP-dependent Zn protease
VSFSASDLTKSPLQNSAISLLKEHWNEAKNNAKKFGACIIHIDEFEILTPKRGSIDSTFNSQREQLVNAFLPFLENAQKDGIIVFRTTNHMEKVDTAIIRPGRFGHHIEIGLSKQRRLY